nr:reverse transcriptase domain-containing protein, chloroplastic [Tanacetum cinerariifolium]
MRVVPRNYNPKGARFLIASRFPTLPLAYPPPEVPMADNRTMAELLQAPIEGYEDAIVIPEIAANNFELKHVVAKVGTSSSTPAVSSEVDELKDLVRALLLDKKNQSSVPVSSSTPASVKVVEPNCVTCGGGNFNQGQLHRPQVNQPPAYQALAYQAPIPQTQSVSHTDFESYVKANDAVLRNMQNQGQNVQNQLANLTNMLSKFMSYNTASSSGSGTLPSNNITNPKEELKGESSHWQYKFPLPVKGVPTARRMEIPLPGVCTTMMKKLPVKENWQLH